MVFVGVSVGVHNVRTIVLDIPRMLPPRVGRSPSYSQCYICDIYDPSRRYLVVLCFVSSALVRIIVDTTCKEVSPPPLNHSCCFVVYIARTLVIGSGSPGAASEFVVSPAGKIRFYKVAYRVRRGAACV